MPAVPSKCWVVSAPLQMITLSTIFSEKFYKILNVIDTYVTIELLNKLRSIPYIIP